MVSTNSAVISAFLTQDCFLDSVSSKSLSAIGFNLFYSDKGNRVIVAHIDPNSPTLHINNVEGSANFVKIRNALVFDFLHNHFNRKNCGMGLRLTDYKFVPLR